MTDGETESNDETDETGPLKPVTAYVEQGEAVENSAEVIEAMLSGHEAVVDVGALHEGRVSVSGTYKCDDCGAETTVVSFTHRTTVGYTTASVRCTCPDGDDTVPMRRVD